MFLLSILRAMRRNRKDGQSLWSGASFSLLPFLLLVAGCQPGPSHGPPAANLPEPRQVLQIPGLRAPVAFSPDGARLAGLSFSRPNVGLVVDMRTGKELLRLPERRVHFNEVAYSPDGKFIAWSIRGTLPEYRGSPELEKTSPMLLLADSTTGEIVRYFPSQTTVVCGIAFSPNGKLLAAASASGPTVSLLDVSTGQEVRLLQGAKEPLGDIAFSPDGKQLASASVDNHLRLWEVESGRLLQTITGVYTGTLGNVSFHPSGAMLATGGARVNNQLAVQRYGGRFEDR
jgi:WD40 repeat protein